MHQNDDFLTDEKVDLEAVGRRLGLVVAKYENGREEAQEVAGISSFTLDRYLAGKTMRVDLVSIAAICKGQGISMNWLLYGDDHSKYLNSIKIT